MPQLEKKHRPQTDNIRWLYQRYSAPLLGYIAGMIRDQQKSENYLVAILSRFAIDYEDEILNEQVTWLQLLQYCRSLLPQLRPQLEGARVEKLGDYSMPQAGGEQFRKLDSREKEIFCAIYYHGRSVRELAETMKESEDLIRSQFKLSFDKIRSAGGN